jgi:hypothetical protein
VINVSEVATLLRMRTSLPGVAVRR